ncbi:hypothetical protein An01g06450 [Aspergillus niger]|uniref:Uncharacterized protein n=2 Tax=Aspergillus niger TaxID=5061 RepID=A2Q931_ASPNC|nr:hypothetical protein An01g06450 [Aspergillus niger]CAK43765.1 hypothetical protein An01g06450 [Aspergillus niger]
MSSFSCFRACCEVVSLKGTPYFYSYLHRVSHTWTGPGGVMDTFLPAPGMTDQPGDEGDRFHTASRAIRGSTAFKLKSEECVKRYQQCKLRIHVDVRLLSELDPRNIPGCEGITAPLHSGAWNQAPQIIGNSVLQKIPTGRWGQVDPKLQSVRFEDDEDEDLEEYGV